MTEAAPPVGRIVLPVQLRRVQRLEFARGALEHGVAAMTLLAAGMAGLRAAGTDRLLAVVEVAASCWLLLLLAREARHLAPPRTGEPVAPLAPIDEEDLPPQMAGVDWIGVAAASLIALEIWHRWHQTGRITRPFVISGLFTFAMAVGGRRLVARRVRRRMANRRPRLVLSAEGFDYRGSRRLHLDAAWADVAEVVEQTPEVVHLRLRDGRALVLRARDHVRGAELIAAVREALPRYAPAIGRGTG